MATPHVSGVASLVRDANPDMGYVQLKERLLNSARPLKALKGKTQTGGMVDAYRALTSTQEQAD